jgi:hypothetical protein
MNMNRLRLIPHAACLAAALLASAGGCARRLPPAERVNINNVSALRTSLGGDAAASAVQAGPAAEPTGFATIKGTFKFTGQAPARMALVIDKEQNICAPGGKQVLSEQFVVDPASGGIRDVVIFLSDKKFKPGDPKWEHSSYDADREAQVEFDQKSCIFLSHMFAMRATQKCKVLNSDPIGHNTNIAGGGRAKTENFLVAGNSYAMYAPGGESPEPFAVACNIHPWMGANMLVRNNPYFAVTDKDGNFEIPNVPAGVDLEFRVWQEKTRYISKISINGERNDKFKGRLKLKLTDGETRVLEAVVDAADLPN